MRSTLTAAACALTLAALLLHAREYQFATDDSYISYRYARNLAEGHGLVFNPGFERVEGYTNLLWVLLLAAGAFAGSAPETSAIVLGYGLTACLWLLVCRFAWKTRPRDPPWIWLLAPLMLAATRSVAVWSTGGLETRLFGVLVLAALIRLLTESRAAAELPSRPEAPTESVRATRPWAAFLFALATLTRPDGLLIAGCSLTTAWCWLALRRRRRGEYPEHVPADLRRTASSIIVYAAPVAASVVFRLLYYGEWLPNTYQAKVGGRFWWSMGWDYAQLFAIEYQVWLWLPLLVAGCWRSFRTPDDRGLTPLVFAAAAVPHALYYISIGGDYFEFRPFDLYFPLFFLVMTNGAAFIGRRPALFSSALALFAITWLPAITHRAVTLPSGNTAESVENLRNVLASGTSLRHHYLRLMEDTNTRSVGVRAEFLDSFLRQTEPRGHTLASLVKAGHLPADTHIALGGVGVIPYFSNLRTFDIYVLTNREVASNSPLENRRMAHDRLATLDQLRAAGVDLLHPRIRTRGWVTFAQRNAALVAQNPPQAWTVIDDQRVLVAFMPNDEKALNERFPALDFQRLEFRADATIERVFDYALERSADGRIQALSKADLSSPQGSSTRIPVAGRATASPSSLDSVASVPRPLAAGAATAFALEGWVSDATHGGLQDVVVFSHDRSLPSERLYLTDAEDKVDAAAGATGFVIDAHADADLVRTVGLLVFAVFADGTASRIDFDYLPLMSDWRSEVLPISDGRRLPVVQPRPGLFDGVARLVPTTNGRLGIEGWAADIEEGERPRQIAVYRDGEFLLSLGLNREREDIAERFEDPRLLHSGFRGVVSGADASATSAERYRVFAILLRGVAVEAPVAVSD